MLRVTSVLDLTRNSVNQYRHQKTNDSTATDKRLRLTSFAPSAPCGPRKKRGRS